MDQDQLTDTDYRWLQRYALDERADAAPIEVLAKLEHLGLLMHGWGHTHVVTELGRRTLDSRNR